MRNYTGRCVADLDERNPNGKYSLDLSNSVDSLIAKRLLELAREHGVHSWKTSLLNDYPFHLSSKVPVMSIMLLSYTKCQMKAPDEISWEIPNEGQLFVEFVASKRPSVADHPLSNSAFDSVWYRLAADRKSQTASRQARDTCLALSILIPVFKKDSGNIRRGWEMDRTIKSSLFMTEHWKVELLAALCWDYYFTCEQAKRVVETFTYGQDKVRAATAVRHQTSSPTLIGFVRRLPVG